MCAGQPLFLPAAHMLAVTTGKRGETQVSYSELHDPSQRILFMAISSRAAEHSADIGAMATLRAVPDVADVLQTWNSLFNERAERLMAVASHVRVGPSQYPVLDKLRAE